MSGLLNGFLRNVGARPELLILTLMVMIIAMLIIPLPTVPVSYTHLTLPTKRIV